MAYDLESIHGFHKVNNVKARELLQPYLSMDGYYLLRPSADAKGGVLCTICVTNRSKLMNYRMVRDASSGMFYIHNHTQFPAINLLISHYQSAPINTEVNTKLLFPVGDPPQQQPNPDTEDAYVIMEKQNPMSPSRTLSGSGVSTGSTGIPGLFSYLPKSEINAVMNPFLGTNGYYLLRPSSTSEGQLTLAVSYKKSVLNFKINFEGGKYFISPKNKFSTIQELLFHFNSHPIRSKKAGNDKILLLYPVPVDEEKEQLYEEVKQQRAAKHEVGPVLAPGWSEHWHVQYNRTYYYNAETGESVWEPPVAAPPKRAAPPLPEKSPTTSRAPRMKDRPLPSVPGTSSEQGESSGKTRKPSVKYSKQQPLPSTPGSSQTLPSRRISANERGLPPLPPKEETKRSNPPLPPKEDSRPSGGANRPPLPVPSREGKSLPPLPPKDDFRSQTLPKQKTQPPLPAKVDRPPLPPKVDDAPPKSRPKKKRVVEYEDIVPLHQADKKSKGPPPLPDKDTSPAAPPPPPVLAPAPPPPPAVGAPSPLLPRAKTVSSPPPQSSPGSSRPFTAGDLASQKHMLKKRSETVSAEPKRDQRSGMAAMFANAIDTRRKAMVDSESEESDFDDAEEDDWD